MNEAKSSKIIKYCKIIIYNMLKTTVINTVQNSLFPFFLKFKKFCFEKLSFLALNKRFIKSIILF